MKNKYISLLLTKKEFATLLMALHWAANCGPGGDNKEAMANWKAICALKKKLNGLWM